MRDANFSGGLTIADDSALHRYATSESLTLDMPKVRSLGDPIQDYRLAVGLYATGESGYWVLPPESFKTLLSLQLGERLPLQDLVRALFLEFAPSSSNLFPQREQSRDLLLERIRTRRRLIEAKTGVLPESASSIREDRER